MNSPPRGIEEYYGWGEYTTQCKEVLKVDGRKYEMVISTPYQRTWFEGYQKIRGDPYHKNPGGIFDREIQKEKRNWILDYDTPVLDGEDDDISLDDPILSEIQL